MEIVHGNNIWSAGCGKGFDAEYGPEGEYSLDELEKDVKNEGRLFKKLEQEDSLDIACKYLEAHAKKDGSVTGEDIQNALNHFKKYLD